VGLPGVVTSPGWTREGAAGDPIRGGFAAPGRADATGLTTSGQPIIIDDDSYVPSERLLADIEDAETELSRGETTAVAASQLDAYFDSLAQAGQ